MAGSRTQVYAHLVNDELPDQLAVSTCVYHDGLPADAGLLEILDLIEAWFAAFASKPKVILVRAVEGCSPRHTFKSLRSAVMDDEAAFKRQVRALQFFPKGRTTIDDTWRPSVYAAISLERPASAFLCVNQELSAADLLGQLQRGDECSSAFASYGFWFPERFSPLGYFWGISVEPRRSDGAWAPQAARRLPNWRDNTQIGLNSDGRRRYVSAREGFVRDVYPLMLLSETHLARNAGGVSLRRRIEQDQLGELDPVAGKLLWQVSPSKLRAAQSLLDESDITLSGRRLEHLAATSRPH